MAKITLDVDDKNLSTVLTILNNLKSGLINNLDTTISQKAAKPVSSSIASSGQKKYLSKSQYKKKLNQPVLEDEFLATKTSTGKYLNSTDYKNRLKKKEK